MKPVKLPVPLSRRFVNCGFKQAPMIMSSLVPSPRSAAFLVASCLAIGSAFRGFADTKVATGASANVLFVDDEAIEAMRDVVRVVSQPVKRSQPVLKGGPKWDRNPYLFGTVLRDENTGVFRMWYMSYNYGDPISTRTPILYATSKDGIAWERPNLGLLEYEGSKANNILLFSYGIVDQYSPSVVFDQDDPDPSRRYKMAVWDNANARDAYEGGGMYILFSPDGIHWKRFSDTPVLRTEKKERSVSDVLDVMRDPVSRKFLVFAKGWEKNSWDQPDLGQRIIVRAESSDFVHWSEPEVVIRHAFTLSDPQSYGMAVFHYEDVYLGLMRSYKLPGDETADIRLAVSRDSRNWKMVTPEHTFLPVGTSDREWDDGMIMGAAPPVIVGDKMLFFYGGWDGPHDSKIRHANIGLAELTAGRFAAITAGRKGTGQVTTKPFAAQGQRLTLNAIVGVGSIRVGVMDSTGKFLKGFEPGDCNALEGDGVALPVRWKGGVTLPTTAGPIRLVVELKGAARVFGYKLAP
jgi:hypothetical protein